jgi:dihydrofolate synthase / folylpolyglutamate synthase
VCYSGRMKWKKCYSPAEIPGLLFEVSQSRSKKTSDYNLGNMVNLLQELGNPQEKYKVIHVAGTSGKTSTSYFVASLLNYSSCTIGMTVSPHVDSITERVQIQGSPLSDIDFCNEFNIFMDKVIGTGYKLVYFEILMAFAFWEFARANVDYAIIETGIGGLLDCSNIIQASNKICVITDIGMDHTEILGDTLTTIAEQKAGIIHPGNVVFMHSQSEEVNQTFTRIAEQNRGILHFVDSKYYDEDSDLPLFQQRNFNLASHVYQFVSRRDSLTKLTWKQIEYAMHTIVPARMEKVLMGSTTLILDASHNEQKIQTLVSSVQSQYPDTLFDVLFAVANGKDADAILKSLKPIIGSLYVTSFSGQKYIPKNSFNASDLVAKCNSLGIANVISIVDPTKAFDALLNSVNPNKLVTGSFYLLNTIRPKLKNMDVL